MIQKSGCQRWSWPTYYDAYIYIYIYIVSIKISNLCISSTTCFVSEMMNKMLPPLFDSSIERNFFVTGSNQLRVQNKMYEQFSPLKSIDFTYLLT